MRRVIVGLALGLGVFMTAHSAAAARTEEPSVESRTEPRLHTDSSPPYVMIALTTVFVAGGCLYLLFRRGSIAYRARQDEDGDDTSHQN
jgi:hypothetical protein